MSNSPSVRSFIAHSFLGFTPPLIRQALLDESEFQQEYGLIPEAVVTIGDSGITFRCSKLINAIKTIFSGIPGQEITDVEGRVWGLRNKASNGELPNLVITLEGQQVVLPDFAALSQDPSIRLRSLDKAASEVNLPDSARDKWRDVLASRTLEGYEIAQLHGDICDTPTFFEQFISNAIGVRQINVSNLVPCSKKYYERLVGAFNGSSSIRDYAVNSGKQLLRQLSSLSPYEGFLSSLFLASHSVMTDEICVKNLDSGDIVRAFSFLEKSGDITSQLGAIEVGLRILPQVPGLEPYIYSLVEQIRDDDIDSLADGFRQYLALFMLVDGELSRTRLMASEPPFYRRLASLTQAALIHRQLANFDMDDSFYEWVCRIRAKQFYIQSLADMQLEPRWNPGFASAFHMKKRFFGRIIITANKHQQNIEGTKLHDLIFGAGSDSIYSQSELLYSFYPSPLDGTEHYLEKVPTDLSKAVYSQLKSDEIEPSSFTVLVNSALIYRVDSDHAELAAKALKLGNHRLANIQNKSQLLGILDGLAIVAAASRNHMLADELCVLVRVYRQDGRYSLSIEEAVRIILMASASREDTETWKNFVGNWLTEISFGKLDDSEGSDLYSYLKCLCHAAPELWVTCSKAEAALAALNGC